MIGVRAGSKNPLRAVLRVAGRALKALIYQDSRGLREDSVRLKILFAKVAIKWFPVVLSVFSKIIDLFNF